MPAQRLPWIKFWPEAIEHEKFAVLTDAEAWTWVIVWAKASQQPKRWRFASVEHACHVTGRPAKHIRRLIDVRLLDSSDEGLVIHDARHWQDASNITPTQREQPANGDASLTDHPAKGDGTVIFDTPKTDLEGEGDIDRERDIDEDVDTPPPPSAESSPRRFSRRVTDVDDAFRDEMQQQFAEAFGSGDAVRDVIDTALSHDQALKHTDKRAYLRNWLRKDAEAAARRRGERNGQHAQEIAELPTGVVLRDDSEDWTACPQCGKRITVAWLNQYGGCSKHRQKSTA